MCENKASGLLESGGAATSGSSSALGDDVVVLAAMTPIQTTAIGRQLRFRKLANISLSPITLSRGATPITFSLTRQYKGDSGGFQVTQCLNLEPEAISGVTMELGQDLQVP